MPPMMRKTTIKAATTFVTGQNILRREDGRVGAELGDLRESRFVCMFEKQPPELAHYYQLTFTAFRSGHLSVF